MCACVCVCVFVSVREKLTQWVVVLFIFVVYIQLLHTLVFNDKNLNNQILDKQQGSRRISLSFVGRMASTSQFRWLFIDRYFLWWADSFKLIYSSEKISKEVRDITSQAKLHDVGSSWQLKYRPVAESFSIRMDCWPSFYLATGRQHVHVAGRGGVSKDHHLGGASSRRM